MIILWNVNIFYGEDQNLLESQMSWDFAKKIVDFSESDISEGRNKLEHNWKTN